MQKKRITYFFACPNSGEFLSNNGRRGGAIYQSNGSLWLDDVMLTENESTWGGGLYLTGDKAVTTLTENTKFFDNTARRIFGGVLVKSKGTTLTVNSKTGDELKSYYDAPNLYLEDIQWKVDWM